eukprot:GILK01005049.1.p1 GENE.GILK01005049.1~~GILK01005049.1.p1  ORF type:complete len:1033 (+),score=162.65 GILK01005049.1:118-3216(+)
MASAQKRWMLEWSPFDSKQFFVGSPSDVRLYKVDNAGSNTSNRAAHSAFHLQSITSEIQGIRCVAWSPRESEAQRMCVGLATGKVLLIDFARLHPDKGGNEETNGGAIVKEFVPRFSRMCNDVAWNPVYTERIAAGLDKVRSDFCTLVWDINVQGSTGPPTIAAAPPVAGLHRIGSLGKNLGSSTTSSTISSPSTDLTSGAFLTISPVTSSAETVTRPWAELANSEATVALSWIPDEPQCLASGAGMKWLRIYDIRTDMNSPLSVAAHSKGVYGVTFDQFNQRRLSTYSDDGIIKIWDISKLSEPLFVIDSGSKSLSQIAWSCTRPNVLASIARDESWVGIWDLHDANKPAAREGTSMEPTLIRKPSRKRSSIEPLSSIAWHPSQEHVDRMLTVTISGVVEDVTLHDAIPISVSPLNQLTFASGKLVFSGSVESTEVTEGYAAKDISVLMHERAVNGYSLNPAKNLSIVSEDPQSPLVPLWAWILDIQQLEGRPDPQDEFPGIALVLQQSRRNSASGFTAGGVVSSAPPARVCGFPVFSSPERTFALRVCGWTPQIDPRSGQAELENIVRRLESRGKFIVAAAISIFHLNMQRAVMSLMQMEDGNVHTAEHTHAQKKEPHESGLSWLALAIISFSQRQSQPSNPSPPTTQRLPSSAASVGPVSASVSASAAASSVGFGSNNASLWKEMCGKMKNQVTNPYLKAIVGFLSSGNEGASSSNLVDPQQFDYSSILYESGLALKDRVAFACRFLSDAELSDYIRVLTELSVVSGDPAGLLLTGLNTQGVNLVEKYVDNTGDVQTAALCLSFVAPTRLQDRRVNNWIIGYRDLMDVWQLWHERAAFDVARTQSAQQTVPPTQQLCARCYYCGQPLTLGTMVPGHVLPKGHANYGMPAGSSEKAKIFNCPNCKKPLPRCSLCLLPLGCVNPFHEVMQRKLKEKQQPQQMDSSRNLLAGGGFAPTTILSSTKLDDWFTWCQTCRHGGHAIHIREWFRTHQVCPVTDCNCNCLGLDSHIVQHESDFQDLSHAMETVVQLK